MPYGVPGQSSSGNFNPVVNGDAGVFQKTTATTNSTQTFSIINGTSSFPVNTGIAALNTGPDQWFLNWVNAGAGWNITYGRLGDHPVSGGNGWCLSAAHSSGAVNSAATSFLTLNQPIEASSFFNLLFRPALLSFFVKSSNTGPHYCALYAGGTGLPGGSRSFVMPYRVDTANAWEKKTIALDFGAGTGFLLTAASPLANGARGFTLHFPLVAGSNFQTSTFNAWSGAGSSALAGSDFQQMGAGTSLRVTNVAILPGISSEFPMTHPADELLRCQRYFWCSRRPSGGSWTDIPLKYYVRTAGVFNESLVLPFPVQMAYTPTILSLNQVGTVGNWRNFTAGADSGVFTTDGITPNYAVLVNPQAAGDAVGNEIRSEFAVIARL